MRALLHVHSDYSYDGESSLENLAGWGARRGLDAILLSEHVNDFDAGKMTRLVTECTALQGRGAELVPGLEFSVRGGFHILGYHLTQFRAETDPAAVVRFIHDQGGIAVLAHPARYRGPWPAEGVLRSLDGIEVWNARYDGRFFPSGAVLSAFAQRRRAYTSLRAYGGHDLHAATSQGLIVTEAPDASSSSELIAHLRLGRASFGGAGLRFSMESCPRNRTIRLAAGAHRLYRIARGIRSRLLGSRKDSALEET